MNTKLQNEITDGCVADLLSAYPNDKQLIRALYHTLVEAIVIRDAGISAVDARDYSRARGMAKNELAEVMDRLQEREG